MNLNVLNSAAKYPSIETYHALDPANGKLLDKGPAHTWYGPVVLTEKVDGTNGRIILRPGGDYFIGSREELLYAKGDRIENPALGIVPALKPLADRLCLSVPGEFSAQAGVTWAFFLEVYGHRIGGSAKQYTVTGKTGYRLFDVAGIAPEVLDWPREQVSSWRQNSGQGFLSEELLQTVSAELDVPLTPRLLPWGDRPLDSSELPVSLEETRAFLGKVLPSSLVTLDDGASGRPEGLVIRTRDRGIIAKARFQDYDRTLKRK